MTRLRRNWLLIALFCGVGVWLYVAYDADPALGASADAEGDVANTGICNRTRQVWEAILKATKQQNCAKVSHDNLGEVTKLDLSGLSIRELKKGDFSDLQNLTHLNLSNNQLQELPEGMFEDLNGLEAIVLSCNPFRHLKIHVAGGVTVIRAGCR